MTTQHRLAAILSVGDELTLGQTLDTNSRWLSARLSEMGIVPVEHATVPDDLASQTRAFRRLAQAADLVICSGGLGPTADDLTRHALAAATDDVLVEDAAALEQVRSWYTSRQRAMPEINRVQALRPTRAESVPNSHGTAPGVAARFDRLTGGSADVFCLPGPPGELMPMFEASVVPRLRPPSDRLLRTGVLHCFGIGESDLATRLGTLMERDRNPLVGTTASGGVVSCRVRYEGSGPSDLADRALAETMNACCAAAGPFAFSDTDPSLPAAVLELLRSRGESIGTVESCTGGLVGALLTDVPGASATVRGGLVTYSNELKQSLAGVPAAMLGPGGPGATRETARALASGGLARLGCDHCLAITGIAGPEGGTPQKPVGTVWIARAGRDGSLEARHFLMAGSRQTIRDWSAKCALAVLRFHLCGLGRTRMLREVTP